MSNIVKGSGLLYTTGVPNTIPSTAHDSEFAIDINGNQYAWNRTTSVWDNLGQGIEIATSSIAPTHVPSKFRPRFVITPTRELYFYSGSWGLVNPTSGGGDGNGIYSGSGTVPDGTVATTRKFEFRTDMDGGWNVGQFSAGILTNGFYSSTGTTIVSGSYPGIIQLYAGTPFEGNSLFTSFKMSGDDVSVSLQTFDGISDIPKYQILQNFGGIYIQGYNSELGYRTISVTDSGIFIQDVENKGLQYEGDYSDTIKTNDRSIPDVGTVKQIARPYKVYTALLTQSGTDDPVATVLENTLSGTPVWTRDVTGQYSCNLTGEFTANKTVIIAYPTIYVESPTDIYNFHAIPGDVNFITVQSFLNYNLEDGMIGAYNQFILEIRVYP